MDASQPTPPPSDPPFGDDDARGEEIRHGQPADEELLGSLVPDADDPEGDDSGKDDDGGGQPPEGAPEPGQPEDDDLVEELLPDRVDD